jgi:terminal uridylyltransferase
MNSSAGPSSPHASPGSKKLRRTFMLDLNSQLYDFVLRLLPTQDELAIKEDVRRLLEKLIRTIEADSRLLAFGSTANGFSLRNSGTRSRSDACVFILYIFCFLDMDLCCIVDSSRPPRNATEFVTLVGALLERGI